LHGKRGLRGKRAAKARKAAFGGEIEIFSSRFTAIFYFIRNIFSQKRPQARSMAVKSVFLSPISPPAFA